MKRLFRFVKNTYAKYRRLKERKRVVKPAKINPGKMMKWGRVICHTSASQGANTILHGQVITENAYCKGIYQLMKIFTPVGNRDLGGIKGAYDALAKKGCNATLEFHLNAFNTKAEGYEVLILKGDTTSRIYAEALLDMMEEKYPDRVRRGIREVEYGQGGYKNLKTSRDNGSLVAILPELFFLDNPDEFINAQELAGLMDDFLVKFDSNL